MPVAAICDQFHTMYLIVIQASRNYDIFNIRAFCYFEVEVAVLADSPSGLALHQPVLASLHFPILSNWATIFIMLYLRDRIKERSFGSQIG